MSSWRNCCLGWWQGQKLSVIHSGDHDHGGDHRDHDDGSHDQASDPDHGGDNDQCVHHGDGGDDQVGVHDHGVDHHGDGGVHDHGPEDDNDAGKVDVLSSIL